MTTKELVDLLQFDLRNERKHLLFYLHSTVLVQGLHREEIGEFLHKEAQSELEHVREFSQMIVYLGEIPGTEYITFPTDLVCPHTILDYARQMEEEVAANYAERLRATHEMSTPEEAALHVFYEEQIADSWKTAKELQLMIKRHSDHGHWSGGEHLNPHSCKGAH